jgi:hypothetical protein
MSESCEVAVEDLQPTSLANTGQWTLLLQAQMDPFSPIITVSNMTVFVSSSPPSGQLSKYRVDLQVYQMGGRTLRRLHWRGKQQPQEKE